MPAPRLVKNIKKDIENTLIELRSRDLLRDEMGISERCTGGNTYEISFSGKNDTGSIVYDNHISGNEIIETLLCNYQYTILLYDKGLIQAEFIVKDNQVIKERLVFMKKHNRVLSKEEIDEYEAEAVEWFELDEGVPIMIRIDYAPDDHVDGKHAATHMTISNHESCRIPIKGIVTFSEFVRFIMFHFYDVELQLKTNRSSADDTITDLEKKMVHFSWV